MTDPKLDKLCINTIRFLAVDAVQRANSGHPGNTHGSGADGICAGGPVP